jgi:hypothetical protein
MVDGESDRCRAIGQQPLAIDMILTIDNFDGSGARDYTGALDAERPPHVYRLLNRPSRISAWLYAPGAEFVVPARGARVELARNNGGKVFTGHVTAAPQYEYLGWDERGPVYRYALQAAGDEAPLSAKALPPRATFVQRGAGEALRTLANDLTPGALDGSGCEDAAVLPEYWPDPRLKFHEHAAELALRARASYRAHDGQLFFRPIAAAAHIIAESSPEFCPDALKLTPENALLNDVTVSGAFGPASFVKDYFYGDGSTLGFYLSEIPFLPAGSVLVEEEYRGTMLRPEFWSVADPEGAIAVSQGRLRVNGGTGALGVTLLRFAEKVPLGGALVLEHGEFEFSAPADALAGGLYNGTFTIEGCFAGFHLTPSGAATQIAAAVNGAVVGQTLNTIAGRRYALSTRIYAGETYRNSQIFPSAEGAMGGATIPSGARILLQVREIDPNNPASQAAPATVLYEGWLPDAPAVCDYALINAASMQASVPYTHLARLSGAEVRSCKLFGAWHDRLVGSMSEGGECQVSNGQLRFYPASAPEATEKIVVSYRAGARAMARVSDSASIAAQAHGFDDGRRSAVLSVASPTPRTSEECEEAARAILSAAAGPAWRGEYRSSMTAEEIFPGDAIVMDVPTRAEVFTAIVREVEIEAADLLDDRSHYTIRFASESAEPVALRTEPAARLSLPDAVDVTEIGSTFLAAASAAEIIDISSTEVMIDAGCEPAAGGGIEVRRSDSGWGREDDCTLINRFDYRIFTVARLSRSQTWYLRPYDGSGKYSRVSTILHVDCAL